MQRAGTGRPRLAPVSVEEIVQTDVVTARPDAPVASVVAQMAEEQVGSVVITEDERPVGIVTDRTIALALETTPDVSDREIRELVGEELVTGSTDMSVFDVLQVLGDNGIRRLPIVEEDGTLSGIVTLDDVVVLLSTELANATDVIEAQSPRF